MHEGQNAEIKVDTFNFTRYGLLHGRVLSVSQDAIAHDKPQERSDDKSLGAESSTSEPKGQELVYAARISLERTQMQVEDSLVNLSPGMAVTLEDKTGSRAIITYLLYVLALAIAPIQAGEFAREISRGVVRNREVLTRPFLMNASLSSVI